MLWLSPLREVELLRALQQLADRGWIALEDPDPADAGVVAEVE